MRNYKLLLVDDEVPSLAAMRAYLQGRGFDVDCATERAEAEAMLEASLYDCVITDLRLSAVHSTEGLDVVSFAKAISASTRVVLLTAYGSPGVEAEARARGLDAFLAKPKRLGEIESVIRNLVGVAR